ncbi:hypothetical protein GPECTOR_147g17 [Gonium pectorale]|uniref:Uncharacterized protein n=1 Tax=Gonium pectorale TaxID=33097 RepID=A0A150FXU0_GONPE|nr:hypothetical protein GPECTOR_147g17 [Gonium pectorale]|eukprot:KXZ42433.1 hypothetical protein GPECTOR_147g17 [Gonium pectorale]
MCNDAPQVDGSDAGVRRRIRKLDYVARFVAAANADPERHLFSRDENFVPRVRGDPKARMEFLRLLLDHYDHAFDYAMPRCVLRNSTGYLLDNDSVFKFVSECIVPDPQAYFTLKQAKEAFKASDHFNHKISTLKRDLEKHLGVMCEEQKRVGSKVEKNVFIGFRIAYSSGSSDSSDFVALQ